MSNTSFRSPLKSYYINLSNPNLLQLERETCKLRQPFNGRARTSRKSGTSGMTVDVIRFPTPKPRA